VRGRRPGVEKGQDLLVVHGAATPQAPSVQAASSVCDGVPTNVEDEVASATPMSSTSASVAHSGELAAEARTSSGAGRAGVGMGAQERRVTKLGSTADDGDRPQPRL
jgi:hypothetical protein